MELLSYQLLVESFIEAKQRSLEPDFINLLKEELKKRETKATPESYYID